MATKGDANDLLNWRKNLYEYGLAAEKGGQPVSSFYNSCAGRYDKIHANNYPGARNFATVASEFINDKTSRILDAASGTGLIGKELKNLGYTCVDALDPSQGSLDKCKEHECHQEYICDTLDEHQTQTSDNRYDAVVMGGAFGVPGHVSDNCFPELIRITKPGGYIMFTFSENVMDRLEHQTDTAIGELSRQGRWELVDSRWIQYVEWETVNIVNEKAKVLVLRVLPK